MEKPSLVVLSLEYLITQVDAAKCTFMGHNQTEKHLHCGHGCCDTGCCMDQYIYRAWYFWVCLMLAMTVCSFGGRWYYRYKYVHHRVVVGHIDTPMTNVVDTSVENATAGSGRRTTDLGTAASRYDVTGPRDRTDLIGDDAHARYMVSVIAPPRNCTAPPSYESLFFAGGEGDQSSETVKPRLNATAPNNARLGSYVYSQDVTDYILF